MTGRPLTDLERVELAIPARLVWDLAAANCFSDPDDQVVERLKALVRTASLEPLQDLPPKARGKLARRIERVVDPILEAWKGSPAVAVAMAFYYFLEDLLAREVLDLWEGSAFAEAMAILLPMMEHGFADEDLDEAARIDARALLFLLKEGGFYRIDAAATA